VVPLVGDQGSNGEEILTSKVPDFGSMANGDISLAYSSAKTAPNPPGVEAATESLK
jgi:hypothetical protein